MTTMLTEYYNQLALSKDSLAATSSYLGGPNLFSNLQKNNTSMRPLVDPKLTPPIQGETYLKLFHLLKKLKYFFFRFSFLWIS